MQSCLKNLRELLDQALLPKSKKCAKVRGNRPSVFAHDSFCHFSKIVRKIQQNLLLKIKKVGNGEDGVVKSGKVVGKLRFWSFRIQNMKSLTRLRSLALICLFKAFGFAISLLNPS